MKKNVLIYGGIGVIAVGALGYMLMTANPGNVTDDAGAVSDAGSFFPTTMFAPGSLNASGSYSTDDSLSQLLQQQSAANTQSYNLQMEQLASNERIATNTNNTQLALANINKETTVTTALANQISGIVSGMKRKVRGAEKTGPQSAYAYSGQLGYKDGQITLNVAGDWGGMSSPDYVAAQNAALTKLAQVDTTPATAQTPGS